MPRNLVAGLSILVSALLAAGWMLRVQAASADQQVIRFAYLGSEEDARHQAAQRFKQYLERESNGSLRVELYPGAQLGGDRDAIEGVRLGTIEMTACGASVYAMFEPAMSAIAVPFLFQTFEEAWAFNDSPLNASITDRLQRKGLRVLANWDNGFRCLTNSSRPVHTPEDMRNMKIRTPESAVILWTMEALGANPSPLPWPEVYMALQQQAFDGQENPIPTIAINKLQEVQHYLSLTNHIYESMPVVISDVFWNGLTDSERELVAAAARDSQEFNRSLVRQQTEEMLADLEAGGMEITRPDPEPFEKATKSVRDRLQNSLGADLVNSVMGFVQKDRQRRAAQ